MPVLDKGLVPPIIILLKEKGRPGSCAFLYMDHNCLGATKPKKQ